MQPVNLFTLATNHSRWLSERQLTIAANIANANTPAYKSLDVAPFAENLETARLAMAVSNSRHIAQPQLATANVVERQPGDEAMAKHSGNTVSIERELLKAQSVRRSFAMNTAIIKAFHGLVMASAKG